VKLQLIVEAAVGAVFSGVPGGSPVFIASIPNIIISI
jgi:hypothetical protein